MIDVETTGLGRTDSIVEIAIVTLDVNGAVVSTFDTLVNPLRDVGPTWIHGIRAADVVAAPTFSEIADTVAAHLDQAVVVAHNHPFDTRMTGMELQRAGIDVQWGRGLDTLQVTGCKLAVACDEHGVQISDAHRALSDAHAAAGLLVAVAGQFSIPGTSTAAASRSSGRAVNLSPRRSGNTVTAPQLAGLAQPIHTQPDLAPYELLLDRVLDDLTVTDDERAELATLATDLGLNDADIDRAHQHFVRALIDAALDDGIVSDDELNALLRAAALLNVPEITVTAATHIHRTESVVADLSETVVCFTGDAIAPGALDRDQLTKLSETHGLEVIEAVTKRCTLLVATDPATLSGKAQKAHKYGIPIAAVNDFTAALHSRASNVTAQRLRMAGVANVCQRCGTSWTATRRAKQCQGCRRGRTPAAGVPALDGQ